jgi:cysteinyl-tRNA synthetase
LAISTLSSFFAQVEENTIASSEVSIYQEILSKLDALFGLGLLGSKDISVSQKKLLAERANARTGKEWDRSDQLRNQLSGQGIGVRDTVQSQVWYRL